MKRWPAALVLFLVALPVAAQTPTPEQKRQTVAYLLSLEQPDGGFVASKSAKGPATLPTTGSAARAIKYFGGQLKNPERTAAFVQSCRDPATGLYAATPGGKANDVRTNALAMLALAELKVPLSERDRLALWHFVGENGGNGTFEEMRITAAAFEAMESQLPVRKPLELIIRRIEKDMNPDGTFGKGANLARDTGGAAAAILRLGGKLKDCDRVVQLLKNGQGQDGAWSKEGEAGGDLETSYRIMRALKMLGAKPNVAALEGFIARCRQDDGSYGVRPGAAGDVSGTYFAGIILYWLKDSP